MCALVTVLPAFHGNVLESRVRGRAGHWSVGVEGGGWGRGERGGEEDEKSKLGAQRPRPFYLSPPWRFWLVLLPLCGARRFGSQVKHHSGDSWDLLDLINHLEHHLARNRQRKTCKKMNTNMPHTFYRL